MFSHLLINFPTGHGRLRVASVLDPDGRADLERRLPDAVAAGCTRLELDCGRIDQLDRWAVVAIAAARAEMESRGGSLIVTRPSEAFIRVARREGREDLMTGGQPSLAGAKPVLLHLPSLRHRTSRRRSGVRTGPTSEGSPD